MNHHLLRPDAMIRHEPAAPTTRRAEGRLLDLTTRSQSGSFSEPFVQPDESDWARRRPWVWPAGVVLRGWYTFPQLLALRKVEPEVQPPFGRRVWHMLQMAVGWAAAGPGTDPSPRQTMTPQRGTWCAPLMVSDRACCAPRIGAVVCPSSRRRVSGLHPETSVTRKRTLTCPHPTSAPRSTRLHPLS